MSKGFDVQFHWIFIMIAGALILTFFITVLTKYQIVSQERYDILLSKQIEAILTGASIAKQTAQVVQLPTKIEIDCSETCQCGFITGTKKTSFKQLPVFSSNNLKGAELVYTTLDWNIPFRAGVFVYLTATDEQYTLVYDPSIKESTQLLAQITSITPPGMSIKNKSITKLIPKEEKEQSHLIFLEIPPPTDYLRNNNKPSIVQITKSGTVQYYDQNTEENKSSSWSTEAELIGAVFSTTQQQYTCSMRQAYNRAQFVARVQKERVTSLTTSCSLASITDALEQLAHTTKTLAQTTGTDLETQSVITMRQIKERLEYENQQLIKANCPPVY